MGKLAKENERLLKLLPTFEKELKKIDPPAAG
jgi:hypothetical protein